MYKLIIKVQTEKAAKYLKSEIESLNPLLEGQVSIEIVKDAEIKPLDKLIAESANK